jgi:hypothetical protein
MTIEWVAVELNNETNDWVEHGRAESFDSCKSSFSALSNNIWYVVTGEKPETEEELSKIVEEVIRVNEGKITKFTHSEAKMDCCSEEDTKREESLRCGGRCFPVHYGNGRVQCECLKCISGWCWWGVC